MVGSDENEMVKNTMKTTTRRMMITLLMLMIMIIIRKMTGQPFASSQH